MTFNRSLLGLTFLAALVVGRGVHADESMANQSAQPAPAEQPASTDATQKPAEAVSACSADLRSDSPETQKAGARCAAEKKDEKAVPDLIQLVKRSERSEVLAEALYALAAIGENRASTDALIEKSGDPALTPAERYIVVAALVALRNDTKKEQILNLLGQVEQSDKSDDILKDLATRLKKVVGG